MLAAIEAKKTQKQPEWCAADYRELMADVGRLGHSLKKPQIFFRSVVRLAILEFLDGGATDGGSDGCLAADTALLPPGLWTQSSALYGAARFNSLGARRGASMPRRASRGCPSLSGIGPDATLRDAVSGS